MSEWRSPSPRSGVAQPASARKSDTTATMPGDRARRLSRLSARARLPSSPAPSATTPSPMACSITADARRPLRGGMRSSSGPPQSTRPARPPRRMARRANTVAAPAATSLLSRRAVPNAIEGETSSTIHAVISRSGTCSRTCGTPVRALAAGSSWRTSSPGWYTRSCASSVPEPTPGALCSPGNMPALRRTSARSSASRMRAGVGPGPWLPGEGLRARAVTRRVLPRPRGWRPRPARPPRAPG
jgi:hypothetical protein